MPKMRIGELRANSSAEQLNRYYLMLSVLLLVNSHIGLEAISHPLPNVRLSLVKAIYLLQPTLFNDLIILF